MPTLSELDHQIAALEAQKKQIVSEEKKRVLSKVENALKELNALGYNYKLTGTTTTGTRRTGIRKHVLDAVKAAPNGITRAELLTQLNATDKSAQQSVSNALAALKKAGTVDAKDGVYSSNP